jgi:hypothetical protein
MHSALGSSEKYFVDLLVLVRVLEISGVALLLEYLHNVQVASYVSDDIKVFFECNNLLHVIKHHNFYVSDARDDHS